MAGNCRECGKTVEVTVIPKIQMPLSWKQALEEAKELDVVLVPYENERGMEATREIFRSIPEGASIGVMIGRRADFPRKRLRSWIKTCIGSLLADVFCAQKQQEWQHFPC